MKFICLKCMQTNSERNLYIANIELNKIFIETHCSELYTLHELYNIYIFINEQFIFAVDFNSDCWSILETKKMLFSAFSYYLTGFQFCWFCGGRMYNGGGWPTFTMSTNTAKFSTITYDGTHLWCNTQALLSQNVLHFAFLI